MLDARPIPPFCHDDAECLTMGKNFFARFPYVLDRKKLDQLAALNELGSRAMASSPKLEMRNLRDSSQVLRLSITRIIAGGVVVFVHLGMMAVLASHGVPSRPQEFISQPMIAELLAAAPDESRVVDDQEGLDVGVIDLALPELSMTLRPETAIDAPRIDPSLTVDVAFYSARAGLAPGIIATVLLLLDIAPDGAVTSAQVIRSDAGDAANFAALEYARATRWTPGMIDGQPRAMQASLTVILGERS